MTKFKKGDLVQHVPSGCVGKLEQEYKETDEIYASLVVEIPFYDRVVHQPWWTKDCRPFVPADALVEAVKAFINPAGPMSESKQQFNNMKEALAAHTAESGSANRESNGVKLGSCEAEQVEGYKWLAMDLDHIDTYTVRKRPNWIEDKEEWKCDKPDAECFFHIESPPSWLKPGQLWEREIEALGYNETGLSRAGVARWQGYWWSKVEDHGEQGQESAWITDRRPTEDDAWLHDEHRYVMVHNSSGIPYIVYLYHVGEKDWQPVPQCLRTQPPSESCETCKHFEHLPEAYGKCLSLCWLAKTFSPWLGIEGCVYERRQDDE